MDDADRINAQMEMMADADHGVPQAIESIVPSLHRRDDRMPLRLCDPTKTRFGC